MFLYGKEIVPGKKSIGNLLLTALWPVGSTMYVWGGGWNEADDGAGVEARRIGISPCWKVFADRQTKDYDFEKTRYQIHDGLDCSGYVGWVLYNIFEKENCRAGYVMPSTYMAWEFAGAGWGKYTPADQVKDWKAGDIMSMKGHVWIALGMCSDGSVLLLHASPPGVILCGTALEGAWTQEDGVKGDGMERDGAKGLKTSQAIELAKAYMKKYYPNWYERFPECGRDTSYLKNSNQMRWSQEVLADPEDLRNKTGEEVLAWMFGEKRIADCGEFFYSNTRKV